MKTNLDGKMFKSVLERMGLEPLCYYSLYFDGNGFQSDLFVEEFLYLFVDKYEDYAVVSEDEVMFFDYMIFNLYCAIVYGERI